VAAAVEQLGRRPVLGGVPGALAGVAALMTSPSQATRALLAEVLDGQQSVIPTWLYSDRQWRATGEHTVGLTATVAEPRRFDGPDDAPVIVGFPLCPAVRLLVPVATDRGTEIWLTEPFTRQQLESGAVPSIDTSTGLGRVPAGDVTAVPVHSTDTGPEVIVRARATALAMSAAEAVGSCDHLLTRSIDYLKMREQFGQVLAGMQGLKFAAADLFRELEPARSLALAAVDALDGDDLGEMEETATAAKIAVDLLHPRMALEAVQLHGGIGFTWELGLHRHYKRALANRMIGGEDRPRRRLLADRICSGTTSVKARRRSDGEDAAVEIRREVQAWLAQHAPGAPPAFAAHEPMAYQHDAQQQEWIDQVRRGRWLCLSWPEEYGGRGLSPLECIAVNEEFANAGVARPTMGMGESLLAPALLAHASDEQKKRLLPRILSGEDVYCQGFSEPEHGSDLAHLETRGVLDGPGLVVNGTKVWQSGAHRANKIFLLCRTDPDAAAHRGITYCIADMESNGVEVTPLRMMAGDHGFNQVRLENTVVPQENIVGELHRGWHVAMTTLGAERAGGITSQYLGYLLEFNRLVELLEAAGRLEQASDDLVDLWLEIVKMKHNGHRVLDQLRAGLSADDLLSIDKLNWSEYHVRFGADAARLLGMDGVVRPEGPGYQVTHLQRVMLESPGRRIARGTNQIQRRIIAERRLGMPR
jgi:alkylation response protein AidB-like acyl-CoA dehydrogenase